MWIVKGTLLGAGFFVIAAVICTIAIVLTSSARAVGTTAIAGHTIQSPLFWGTLVIFLFIGCAITRRRTSARR
jgi:hypothetical protein